MNNQLYRRLTILVKQQMLPQNVKFFGDYILINTYNIGITFGRPISAMAFSHWITLSVCRKWRPVAWNKDRQKQEGGQTKYHNWQDRWWKPYSYRKGVRSLLCTIILLIYNRPSSFMNTSTDIKLRVHSPHLPNVLKWRRSFSGSIKIT